MNMKASQRRPWDLLYGKSKNRRSRCRDASADILNELNITYDMHNRGAHLVIISSNGPIDFWPGMGKWQTRFDRGEEHEGSTLGTLLALLGFLDEEGNYVD